MDMISVSEIIINYQKNVILSAKFLSDILELEWSWKRTVGLMARSVGIGKHYVTFSCNLILCPSHFYSDYF